MLKSLEYLPQRDSNLWRTAIDFANDVMAHDDGALDDSQHPAVAQWISTVPVLGRKQFSQFKQPGVEKPKASSLLVVCNPAGHSRRQSVAILDASLGRDS